MLRDPNVIFEIALGPIYQLKLSVSDRVITGDIFNYALLFRSVLSSFFTFYFYVCRSSKK